MVLAGFVWLVYVYRVLLGPLIIAALFAYLIYPGVTWLSNRTRINRRRIVVVVYIVFIGLVIWAMVYLIPLIINQFTLLTQQLSGVGNQLDELLINLNLGLGINLPFDNFSESLEANLSQALKPERIFQIIRNAATNIIWLVVIFITTFHLLRDWERMREWFFGLLPEDLQPEYRRLHQQIKRVWQSYLRGQLLVMLFLGLLSGIGAAAVGLPNALLLGFLAGALALIPTLGPAVATAIAALVAWTQGSTYFEVSNLAMALIVVAIFQVVQLVEGFWLTPRIMGRRMSLHPGIVLIAIVGTLFTLGALMALIIVPIIGSFILVFRFARRKRAGLDPWPDEAAEDMTLSQTPLDL